MRHCRLFVPLRQAIADPPPARPPLGAVPNGAPGPASLEAGWRRNKKSKKGEEAEAADAAGAVEAAAVGKLVLRTLEGESRPREGSRVIKAAEHSSL